MSRSPRSSEPAAGGGLAGRHGFRLADGPHDRLERVGLHFVGAPARQQLVEKDAQGVDVAGGRDRLALDLLRARVLGRHHREHGGGGRQVGIDAGGEQLGDAEVQQLRHAVTVHQHVRRLDVAVDHQVLMGVLDGAAHRPEQGHAVPGSPIPCAAQKSVIGCPSTCSITR